MEYEDITSFEQNYLIQHEQQLQQTKLNPSKQYKEIVDLNSFNLMSVIGEGNYAKVALVKKIDTGKIYAMKILKKSYLDKKNHKNRVWEERKVLEEINFQFVIQMKYAFQNDKKLFFVLEFCPGGELFNILSMRKQFTEDQTRFYAAQMILAIEYLHSKNIVYRDLKPENVLIDSQGYIKLTDFGLSKRNMVLQNAKSICGTPEYLAPEILLNQGHGKPVDFWTLGSIIAEMYQGFPPFNDQKRDKLFLRIKYEPPTFSNIINENLVLKDLLERLLEKSPSIRLGNKQGASEIKNHAWFQNFDWEKLIKRELAAPFVPIIDNDDDLLRNFDPKITQTPIYSPNEQHFGESYKNDQDLHYPSQSYSQPIYSKLSFDIISNTSLDNKKDKKMSIEYTIIEKTSNTKEINFEKLSSGLEGEDFQMQVENENDKHIFQN